jgi:acetolactate synthase-1/2/3 large subunit
MMKLSDYVVQFLVDHGIGDIFLASGGGIMHLLDAVGRNPGINYYCNYHEQACAVSAEGYARVKGNGACLVTVGPGAVNALSGIVAAWYDSVPVFVLSGQVRQDLIADYTKIRQFGPQEGNVIDMAKPVTKYAVSLRDPKRIRYEMERAWHEMTSGRPGPVWVEIPLDVQGSQIDETTLESYDPPAAGKVARGTELSAYVTEVLAAIRAAKRPIFIFGNGIHRAGAVDLIYELLVHLRVPVVLPMTAKDVLAEDHEMQMGVFGTAGQRRANFALQNSDCMVAFAVGLCCAMTGFNFKGFAPKAKKIIIDIDEGQLHHQVIKPDIAVQAEIGDFVREALRQLGSTRHESPRKWLDACAAWKRRYPIIVEEFLQDPSHVNSYVFMDRLSDVLTGDDVLTTGNALDCASYYQGFRVKRHQNTIDSKWGSMGWDLPLAVGACIGRGKARTVCATGDGSLQWNVQELLTIKRYRLPIKIFVLNNHGYTAIRTTQTNFFEGRLVGADHASGVDNPDFRLLAGAYCLGYHRIENNAELDEGIARVLNAEGPVICELNVAPEQGISPKAAAFRREDGTFESRPLEDMSPFLPREEVWENMHMFDFDKGE